MSDSVYSDEERDIEEAEKRETIKANEYTLPPLNLDKVDTTQNEKRENKTAKRNSQRNSKRQLKRTSERDPTPYYLSPSHEHGGKENASSTYTLGQRSSPIRSDAKTRTRPLSPPSRPKPSTSRHSKTTLEARKSHRPSHDTQAKERHSRKSIHSRTQSRHSGPIVPRKRHDRSRTQSSAFPFFDAQTVVQDAARRASGTVSTAVSSSAEKQVEKGGKRKSRATRDLSGNLTFHDSGNIKARHAERVQESEQVQDDKGREDDNDDDDDETNIEHAIIETLRSSSIGLCASNGSVNSSTATRQARLASLHLVSSSPSPSPSPSPIPPPPPKSAKRTSIRPLPASFLSSTSKAAPTPPPPAKTPSLCLFPRESMSGARRERTPLSTVQMGGGGKEATPGREEEEKGSKGKNWAGLSFKGIVGRGSRWVSGGVGGGYWDRQDKDDKVFI